MTFATKIAARYQIVAGHSTIDFFSKKASYQDALKDLAAKVQRDRDENGSNGDWQDVGKFETREGEFKTLEEAYDWAYDNVSDYAAYAVKIGTPPGWLFVADIHH